MARKKRPTYNDLATYDKAGNIHFRTFMGNDVPRALLKREKREKARKSRKRGS